MPSSAMPTPERLALDLFEQLGGSSPDVLRLLLISGVNELGQAVAEGRADPIALVDLRNHLDRVAQQCAAQRGH